MIAPASWNRAPIAKKPRSRIKPWLFAVLALLIVITIIAVAVSFENAGSDDADFGHGTIAEVKPAKSGTTNAARKVAVKTTNVAIALENVGEFEKPEIEAASEPVYIDTYTNRYFKTGVEQVMGWVFTCTLGDMPPPLPTLSEDDRKNLAAILISKSEIKDDDDEKAIETKEMVDYAKEEMRAFIKEGGDPQYFMEYYHKELRKANEYRTLVVAQAEEIYEEDPEVAQEFIDKINEELGEKGIRPVSISDFE